MPATCCVERWDRLMREDPDMPVFTLLAKDQLAIETVMFWLERARAVGVSTEKLDKVQEHLDAMIIYARTNPDRVQIPD